MNGTGFARISDSLGAGPRRHARGGEVGVITKLGRPLPVGYVYVYVPICPAALLPHRAFGIASNLALFIHVIVHLGSDQTRVVSLPHRAVGPLIVPDEDSHHAIAVDERRYLTVIVAK